jgi:hypothetical protein
MLTRAEPFNLEIPGERHRYMPIRDANTRHALDIAKVLTSLL